MSVAHPESAGSPAAASPVARTGSPIKKTLLLLLAGLAAVIVGFLVVVAMQPEDFRIARSLKMAAPPSAPFAQVNDFHNWQVWSPWAKLDPNAKNSFEGPAAGEGAAFSWAGNSEVGEGSMKITESREPGLIRLKLEFKKPMEDTADTEFTFKPDGDGTIVTWAMSGKNDFVGRIFCTLFNMDKMVGSKFEEGLASMKAIVEAKPSSEPAPSESAKPST